MILLGVGTNLDSKKANRLAEEPELTYIACFTPRCFEKAASNFFVTLPIVIYPESNTLFKARFSAAPIVFLLSGIFIIYQDPF